MNQERLLLSTNEPFIDEVNDAIVDWVKATEEFHLQYAELTEEINRLQGPIRQALKKSKTRLRQLILLRQQMSDVLMTSLLDMTGSGPDRLVRPSKPAQLRDHASLLRELNQKTDIKLNLIRKRSDTDGQKVLWRDTLIDFVPNKYAQSYQDIWMIESILGSEVVRSSLRENRVLNADFVERLFDQSTYSFYMDRSGSYLLSDTNELFESDFGPLIQLTALEALQRYGLSLLEESKERGYVRL